MRERILWIDDEIELFKPHLIFLEKKGYRVDTAAFASEGIEKLRDEKYDVVFLDEQMPGMHGLEALMEIRRIDPHLPVVMITKSEEENIMEEAIGKEITDYLIKPVNPNEIILSLKKIFRKKDLVTEQSVQDYQREFGKISMDIQMTGDWDAWIDLYKRLVFWSLRMDETTDTQMRDILEGQWSEANRAFFRFIKNNYEDRLRDDDDQLPALSHQVLERYLLPHTDKPILLVVIDNLRYDQWQVIYPILKNRFHLRSERLYYSILPTATQYARNALFAGLMPADIKKRFPHLWKDDPDEGGKNLHEADFFRDFLQRKKVSADMEFFKILNHQFGERTAKQIPTLHNKDIIVTVYNFVDMISHAKTEMDMIKELASNDTAYRALTATWFENSPLLHIIEAAAAQGRQIHLTTDHGTINVKRPTKVIGDRDTSLNLRYKLGRSLTYNPKDVMECRHPERLMLPSPYINGTYIFAKEDYFFVYPNNYNHYVQYFRNTYQHGGISLQEMLVPYVILEAR
ncbi:MAG: bifunctional response regulator/alkaline phosphatase family protein [Chlorobi bacterium]|nr:bifunctional response regulator/alkaline phosphatase family protein [Chlorobiota bacterium]